MAYQELSREEGKVEILARLTGWDLIGTRINAPLSVYKQVYVLPMMSIDPEKVRVKEVAYPAMPLKNSPF
jgi:leucyl-tRNA synthetase